MRWPRGETRIGEIEPGSPGTFSDYGSEPPMVISAMCAEDSKNAAVYHIPGNTQARSALTLVPLSAYSDENLAKELTPEDNTYERDIVTGSGTKGRLVLKLAQKVENPNTPLRKTNSS